MAITIEYKDVENKLLLLYLINLMDLPMSRSQITAFVIQKDIMNHFTLEQNLTDMVQRGFIDATLESAQDENITRYALTEAGLENLGLLENQIPRPVRNVIEQYVDDNRGKIKKGFEKTAHYFPNVDNDEYTVKCGIYDDRRGTMLMEISVPVITREQAKHIQCNWNEHYNTIYKRILEILVEPCCGDKGTSKDEGSC
jgi:DNA-binding PadR family transcriptional regulator